MTRIVPAVLLGLAASGCVSLGGKPPPFLLNLSSAANVAANETRTAASGNAITISVPVVPAAIATNRVAVIDGATSIAYVKDAAWVEPPARLFQRLVSETIAAKTGRVVLDPRQFALDPGTVVTGSLKAFGIDARRSEAVIVYEAALTTDRGATVRTRRFEAHVPVGEVEAASAGRALNTAANKVAEDVAAWVAS